MTPDQEKELAKGFGSGPIALDRLPSRRKGRKPETKAELKARLERERAAGRKRLMRWVKSHPGLDPVTQAPGPIRRNAGLPDQHRREVKQGGGFRPQGQHTKFRLLWTRDMMTRLLGPGRKAAEPKAREVSLHATKGYRSRRAYA